MIFKRVSNGACPKRSILPDPSTGLLSSNCLARTNFWRYPPFTIQGIAGCHTLQRWTLQENPWVTNMDEFWTLIYRTVKASRGTISRRTLSSSST
jgi:hypothetical protein